MMTTLSALVLAAVSIVPATRQHLSWRGVCPEVRYTVNVAAHPDNRELTIVLADEDGLFSKSDFPLRGGYFESFARMFVMREGQTVIVTATVGGAKNRQALATARYTCS